MFRRKSASTDDAAAAVSSPGEPVEPAVDTPSGAAAGPYDAADLPDGVDRVDLGALLLTPSPGHEIRLQVVEKTGEVASAMLVGSEGAMELQAFSAPRHGDLWSEVRPQIVADVERRGGRVAEREGQFGVELMCQVPVKTPEGQQAVQPSRIIGVNGPRWMLRATLLGKPGIDVEAGAEWEGALAQVGVRRGDHAMPVGRALPLKLPDEARKAP